MSRVDDLEHLEDIVERIGAVETVNMISEICGANADEAEEEGDDELAAEWKGLADTLENIEWE